MKKRNHLIAIVILAIALAVSFVVLGGVQWGGRIALAPAQKIGANTAPGGTAPAAPQTPRVHTIPPPQGSVTYQIAQAATQLPGFLQATIDPAEAPVGPVQQFTIVTNDPNPVTSVVAVITTDHKTITVPLVSQGVPAVSMLVPRTISVTSDNTLALVHPASARELRILRIPKAVRMWRTRRTATIRSSPASGRSRIPTRRNIPQRSSQKMPRVIENSVTLQWIDAQCPFATENNYEGGTADINVSCAIPTLGSQLSSVDGPENGNLLVDNGGALMVDAGATLVINSGYSISFSGGGTLLLPSGSQVVFNQDMYGTDNDGDGFIQGNNWSYGPYGSYWDWGSGGTSRGDLNGLSFFSNAATPILDVRPIRPSANRVIVTTGTPRPLRMTAI